MKILRVAGLACILFILTACMDSADGPGTTASPAPSQLRGQQDGGRLDPSRTAPPTSPTPTLAFTPTATWRSPNQAGEPGLETLVPVTEPTPPPDLEDPLDLGVEIPPGGRVCLDLFNRFEDPYQEALVGDAVKAAVPSLVFYTVQDSYRWPKGMRVRPSRELGVAETCIEPDPDLTPGVYYAVYTAKIFQEKANGTELLTEGTRFLQIHIRGRDCTGFHPGQDEFQLADVETGYAEYEYRPGMVLPARGREISNTAWSPDGVHIAFVLESGLAMYDADTLNERWYADSEAPVRALVFSPDGRMVLAGTGDGRGFIWDVPSGKLLRTIESSPHGIETIAAAFHPDGVRIALGNNARIQVWDASQVKLSQEFALSDIGLFAVTFSSDGSQLVSVGSGGMAIWEVASGSLQQSHTLAEVPKLALPTAFAFSPNRRLLAYTTSDHVLLWNVLTGQLDLQLGQGNPAIPGYNVAFSTDQTLLASAGSRLRIWDLESGELICTLKDSASSGEQATVLAFNPDGSRLVSIHGDNRARLWNLRNGTLQSLLEFR